MNINKLMIGNHILHDISVDDLEEIVVTPHVLLMIDISPDDYFGIVITESKLLEIGFIKDGMWFEKGDISINLTDYRVVRTVGGFYNDLGTAKTIHNLQNIVTLFGN